MKILILIITFMHCVNVINAQIILESKSDIAIYQTYNTFNDYLNKKYKEDVKLNNEFLIISNNGLDVKVGNELYSKKSLHYNYATPYELIGFNNYYADDISGENGYLIRFVDDSDYNNKIRVEIVKVDSFPIKAYIYVFNNRDYIFKSLKKNAIGH